jgi:SNF2 family DNA or RNA helicase
MPAVASLPAEMIDRHHWPVTLFGYQRIGITTLLQQRSVLLADEMGLGKTIQAIAALRCLLCMEPSGAALVVVPAGLVLQWRREFRAWAPELTLSTVMGSAQERGWAWRRTAQVFLVGYEALRGDAHLPELRQRDWTVVVLDEAQRIKNAAADISRTIKGLTRQRGWALTGTPLENRLEDLLSILEFVAPGGYNPGQYVFGLRRLLAQVQLRRRRADVLLDLPPKTVSTRLLELDAQQRRAYQRAESEGIMRLRALGVDLRITHVLELILRLKQICNFCPETDRSAKLADLTGRLAEAVGSGQRALVFSQFAGPHFGARRLAQALAAFDPLLLTGELDAQSRASVVSRFQEDDRHKVLVLSLRAGGTGLNLTGASHVFHFDRWWNPAVETQAEDRAHRIGQTWPVQIHAYLSADTIEERIADILAEKRALFADMVDGVTARGLARLDIETLKRIIAPELAGR